MDFRAQIKPPLIHTYGTFMVTAHGSREQFYWYLNLKHQTWRADRYSQMNWLSLRTKQFKASGQWPLISEESVKQTSMHKKTWRSEDVTAWGAMNRRIIDRSVKELQMDVEVWKSTTSTEDAISHGAEQLDLSNSNVNPSPGWVFLTKPTISLLLSCDNRMKDECKCRINPVSRECY